jgi:hypothetical protein
MPGSDELTVLEVAAAQLENIDSGIGEGPTRA